MPVKFVGKPIKNAADACDIAQPFISLHQSIYLKTSPVYKHVKKVYSDTMDMPAPKNAISSRWTQSVDAMERTLHYIFDHLGHKCYMLCVDNANNKTVYQLVSDDLARNIEAATQKQMEKLGANPVITDKQRSRIAAMSKKPMRLLQCVLKSAKNHDDIGEEEFELKNEYKALLDDLVLPAGVYILNLTDAVILRINNEEPFQSVTGRHMIHEPFNKHPYLPIFSLSGHKACSDIPFPNYDDMMIATGQVNPKFDKFVTNWRRKKYNKAVFRGGPSGCGYTVETNQRLRLAAMNSPWIDAAITGVGKTIDSNAVKFDPKYGLGMMNTGLKPAPKFMTMAEQSEYKYIVHVDGNVNAYRLLTTMMTGSVILRVESEYTSWADHLMKPGQHYVLIKPDLSDLETKIQWLEAHPHTAEKIGKNGLAFAKMALDKNRLKTYATKLFWATTTMTKILPKSLTRKNGVKRAATARVYAMKTESEIPSPPSTPSDIPSPPIGALATHLITPLIATPSPPIEKEKTPVTMEIIDMPPNAKRCPKGYVSVNVNGTKKCKKHK